MLKIKTKKNKKKGGVKTRTERERIQTAKYSPPAEEKKSRKAIKKKFTKEKKSKKPKKPTKRFVPLWLREKITRDRIKKLKEELDAIYTKYNININDYTGIRELIRHCDNIRDSFIRKQKRKDQRYIEIDINKFYNDYKSKIKNYYDYNVVRNIIFNLIQFKKDSEEDDFYNKNNDTLNNLLNNIKIKTSWLSNIANYIDNVRGLGSVLQQNLNTYIDNIYNIKYPEKKIIKNPYMLNIYLDRENQNIESSGNSDKKLTHKRYNYKDDSDHEIIIKFNSKSSSKSSS